MALNISDLDALLGYDPATHTYAGPPTARRAPTAPAPPPTVPSLAALPAPGPASRPAMDSVPTIPLVARRAPVEVPSGQKISDAQFVRMEPANVRGQIGKQMYEAGIPAITARPGTPEYGEQKQEQLDYQRAHPLGSEVSAKPGFWGKLEHGLARAGNIAGDVLVPHVMEVIPGTDLNRAAQERRDAQWMRLGAENELQNAQAENLRADAWERMHPQEKELPLPQQLIRAQENIDAAKASGKEPDASDVALINANAEVASANAVSRAAGQAPKFQYARDGTPLGMSVGGKNYTQSNIGDAPPEVQAQWQQANDALNSTKAGVQAAVKKYGLQSLEMPPPDVANYRQGASDPQYAADVSAWAKKIDAAYADQQTRLSAARGAAYQLNRPVNVVMPDGSLCVVSAGVAERDRLTPAAEGVQAMGRNAQIEDIYNGLQTMSGVLNEAGVLKWNPAQVGYMQSAFRSTDPGASAAAWQSLVKSGLSPEQMDFVVAMQQLDERIMSLRNVAGMGQGSDSLREAILRTVPSLTTGSTALAQKQIDALTNEVDNLSMGIPQTPLNKNPQIRNREKSQGGGSSEKNAGTSWKF